MYEFVKVCNQIEETDVRKYALKIAVEITVQFPAWKNELFLKIWSKTVQSICLKGRDADMAMFEAIDAYKGITVWTQWNVLFIKIDQKENNKYTNPARGILDFGE